MKSDIVIAENFYQDPDAVVEYALSLDYIFPFNRGSNSRDRVAWRTSRYQPAKTCPFKSSTGFIRKLEGLIGEQIDRRLWNMDFPLTSDGYPPPAHLIPPPKKRSSWWNCCFHVKHQENKPGDEVHSHTDRDIWNAAGLDGWAGIIYLNKNSKNEAGMTTWKNIDPRHQYDFMTPAKHWKSVDYFSNVYNRIVLIRGAIPHSGVQGWGTNLKNGRLFQTFFFRVQKAKQIRSVTNADLGI